MQQCADDNILDEITFIRRYVDFLTDFDTDAAENLIIDMYATSGWLEFRYEIDMENHVSAAAMTLV